MTGSEKAVASIRPYDAGTGCSSHRADDYRPGIQVYAQVWNVHNAYPVEALAWQDLAD